MRTFRLVSSLLLIVFGCIRPVLGQGSFDLQAYRQFLATHQNMTPGQLRALYPAGTFAQEAPTRPSSARYFDSIDARYHFTPYERSLLQRHSFMATERLRRSSFGQAFDEIYHHDLPVFVSTDAILHALHMSYDLILKRVELGLLIDRLRALLGSMHTQVPALAARYDSIAGMRTSLKDVDVYLTVSRRLLGASVSPFFPENSAVVNQLLVFVQSYAVQEYPLFAQTTRRIDFSQFTPRGHYAEDIELSRYFQAMMWLGRIEIWLMAPQAFYPRPTEQDIQRQTIDAILIDEAAHMANVVGQLQEIDSIIRFFVGESDNVTIPNLDTLIVRGGVARASELLDIQRFRGFQQLLAQYSFAFQRINSQLLWQWPTEVDSLRPASAFLLLGQRFVVDSYTMGNVVYGKIVYNGQRIRRMLPATLDVLFSLGNDATAQLLEPELQRYHYALNLAAVRYLIDAYEPAWWQSSLY
ncbi:MAG: DUF3160 domain-containing protein, partial [Bacteroidota bacterium]